MRIFNLYGIKRPIDFVDVDSTRDTRLFLQAPLIRYRASRGCDWADAATGELDSFSARIFDLVLDGSQRNECLILFENFGEVSPIRLGYAKNSRKGNGSGEKLGEALYAALSGDARLLIEFAGFAHVEEAMLFVPQMGVDRISDMVGQIVMGTLIDYTRYQMDLHPQLADGAKPARFIVWSSERLEWVPRTAVVPHVGGSPLILVPESWTSGHLEFNRDRVIGQGVCRALQAERTTVGMDGKLTVPRIKDLRKEIPTEDLALLRYLRDLALREDSIDALQRTRMYLIEWFGAKEAA